jgi:hypothetical protein
MTYLVPDIRKILRDAEAWRVSAVKTSVGSRRVWKKKINKSQHTISNDRDLLRKLGIDKGDRVLFIAGYYGDWANSIAKAGAKTTYSELSKNLVDYARRKFGGNKNIEKFISANYVDVPKKEGEFDWTVTFESIGINTGLPLAAVRSLRNRKGFKIIHYPRIKKPLEKYSNYREISRAYGARFERRSVFIKGTDQNLHPLRRSHLVTTITTNDRARRMSKEDLSSLRSGRFSKESLRRLSMVSKIINKKYLRRA